MKISIQELFVLFIVALVVLGPDKLPVYARKLGEALKEFRKLSADVTKDIRESIVEPLEEAKRPLQEAMEPVTELESDVKGNMKEIQKSLSDMGKPEKLNKHVEETETVEEQEDPKEAEPMEEQEKKEFFEAQLLEDGQVAEVENRDIQQPEQPAQFA